MTPAPVKWIKGLIILRIVLAILILILVGITLLVRPSSGYLFGISERIFGRLGIENPYDNASHTLGYVIGILVIPFIVNLLELLFVNKKKRIGFWIVLGFDFVFSLSNGSFFLPLILLILSLLPSTRGYFNNRKEDKEELENILDSPF